MSTAQMKHSFVLRLSAVLAFGLAAGASFGYDPGDYSTWYQFTSGDAFSAECWVDPADATQTKKTADPGMDCFIPAGLTSQLKATVTATFPGRHLAVSGTIQFAKASQTFTIGGLILCPGGVAKFGSTGSLAGGLTVEGTAENPSVLGTFNQDGRTLNYTFALHGGPNAVLDLGYRNSSPSASRESLFGTTHNLNANFADYAGELLLAPNLLMRFAPVGDAIPGRLTVCNNAILQPQKSSGAYAIGGLVLADGAELNLKSSTTTCPYFEVSNEFSVGESLRLCFSTLSPSGFCLARLTGAAAENAPDVSDVDVVFPSGWAPPNARLEISDADEEGVRTVNVVWDELAIMWTQNSNSLESQSAFTAGNGSYWSTGVVPSSDFDGIAYAVQNIMFWQYGQMYYDDMTLVLADGKTLFNQTYGLHLKEVQAVGSVKIFGSNGRTDQPNRLYAPLRILGGTCSFSGGWGNHWTELDGPISGSGTIVLGYSSASGNTVNGDDSGFTGNYTVSGGISLDDPLTRPNFYIGVGGSFAFGGSYTGAEAWRSVYSTNAYYVISADVSMTNETRGVYLNQANVFEVAQNKTLKITEAMTYNGAITKSGAGALVLGNATTKFIASGAQADAPTEGLNGLAVAAGTLEVAAVDAVNGLAVSFGPEASLVVNVGATGDLKTYGARNVKWETPFAADAAIPVVFAGEMSADSDTFAICTISETAAVPTFTVPAKYAHRKVTALGWRTNDDGSKTYEVVLEKQGILLIVR